METPTRCNGNFQSISRSRTSADIETELHKAIPNGKAYHIDEVLA